MNISVILCTYNRAAELQRTLAGFQALAAQSSVLSPQSSFAWELVVVDNNSTDETKDVVAAALSRRDGPDTPTLRGSGQAPRRGYIPGRYIFESQPGQSAARNRGIDETAGDLVVFTDDDVDVEAGWLAQYRGAATRHPQASFFGGKVLPRWECPPPRWLAENSSVLLDGVTVHVDKGETERVIGPADKWFFGANMAFRRRVFDGGLRFREDIGLAGAEPVRGEDTDLQKQLLARGDVGVYVPGAVAHHRTPPQRMTECYVRQWFAGQGRKWVRLGTETASNHVWLGAPRHLWRKCLTAGGKYAATRWTCPARVWLPAEIQMARTWGMITECKRQKVEGRMSGPEP